MQTDPLLDNDGAVEKKEHSEAANSFWAASLHWNFEDALSLPQADRIVTHIARRLRVEIPGRKSVMVQIEPKMG